MKKKFYIKKELMCGVAYYMIYRRIFIFWGMFFERWNAKETAETRLSELLNLNKLLYIKKEERLSMNVILLLSPFYAKAVNYVMKVNA